MELSFSLLSSFKILHVSSRNSQGQFKELYQKIMWTNNLWIKELFHLQPFWTSQKSIFPHFPWLLTVRNNSCSCTQHGRLLPYRVTILFRGWMLNWCPSSSSSGSTKCRLGRIGPKWTHCLAFATNNGFLYIAPRSLGWPLRSQLILTYLGELNLLYFVHFLLVDHVLSSYFTFDSLPWKKSTDFILIKSHL